ncbi:histidine phosphatase family protein [Acetobacter tropicalis]|uniref:histidine phosphatase family protein n=1 Tax=Acetobacter TaxID=434 RepID=UPI0016568FC6|nr:MULTISPECIES: histidine phosphatase family protein [Acetobacter]MBC9009656.1 histidine phosphatase family protein [Acetobacter tropicalis]MCG0995496.1 histidine phosphatase family protein [Acetobacter indonesiensis]MDO8172120.1 histidine phosphatase family protein [Acetobacter tropicalis]
MSGNTSPCHYSLHLFAKTNESQHAGIVQKLSDQALNDTGRQQAYQAAQKLKNLSVTRVLVSPLQRAIETARLAFPDRLEMIEIEENLTECDFGKLDGKSIKNVMIEHGINEKQQLVKIISKYGESWEEIQKRCNSFFTKMERIQDHKSRIVLVGHDVVFQAISEKLTGLWLNSQHGQPNYFNKSIDGWKITEFNESFPA